MLHVKSPPFLRSIVLFCFTIQFDDLGFVGFAIGFLEEKTHIVGTSKTSTCFTPAIVEYLHALAVVGRYISTQLSHAVVDVLTSKIQM